MTPIDTQALRAGALAASQEDWHLPFPERVDATIYTRGPIISGVLARVNCDWPHDNQREQQRANLRHIIAAQPATIIALLDELDALRAAAKPAKGKLEYPAAFESAWGAYPPRANANKRTAFKAWDARRKSGAAVADMLAGAARYAAYIQAERTEERYTLQPATFFGPDEHYMLPWRPTRGAPVHQDANEEAKRRLFGGDDGAFNAAG